MAMRILILAAVSLFVLLTLLPMASAEEDFACHSWEIFVGERTGIGAGVSTDDGATYVGTGEVYLVQDGPPVVNPWLFSFWPATEENGEPGLQRGDCGDPPESGSVDCLLSCTF